MTSSIDKVQLCFRPALLEAKRCLASSSHKVLLVFVIIVLIVSPHSSQSSEAHSRRHPHSPVDTAFLMERLHRERYQQCKTDSSCRDLVTPNMVQHVLCVDSYCKCGPNYRIQLPGVDNSDQSSEDRPDLHCVKFECAKDEDCQEYDHHRVCQVGNGSCVCRDQFLEDDTNGQKCVPQYGAMPAYSKQSRKFLNKNRISYREDIEHWPNKQALWLQYCAFAAAFVGQICMLVYYVAKRRKKMMQKILNRNLVDRQNSDQVPIAEDRSYMA